MSTHPDMAKTGTVHPATNEPPVPRVLVLSNGHGEDAIACRIIDRLLARGVSTTQIDTWPIVGEGRHYRARGLACVGAANLLPSEGFATLSLRSMWRDLRAGWIGVHAAQMRAAAALRLRYTCALAVGDVVPMALAAIARVPFVFVGCAKSVHYGPRHGYTSFEVRLLRRHAVVSFPRDEPTTAWLSARGVEARSVGNPMMDDLEPGPGVPGIPDDHTVIAALPGSRHDMTANTMAIANVAAHMADLLPDPVSTHVVCAAVPGIDVLALRVWAHEAPFGTWTVLATPPTDADFAGHIITLVHRTGIRVHVWTGHFVDVLRRSRLVIGLAGTANEQAVGLGKPVVTFPTEGAFNAAYLRMKMRYLDGAAIAVAPEPRVVARAVVDLLGDTDRLIRMAEVGRQRMGSAGASDAIADDLELRLRRRDGPR